MRALRVEVKTTVNVFVSDEEDIWEIKQNVLNAVHDKIHFLEKNTFYLNYE